MLLHAGHNAHPQCNVLGGDNGKGRYPCVDTLSRRRPGRDGGVLRKEDILEYFVSQPGGPPFLRGWVGGIPPQGLDH